MTTVEAPKRSTQDWNNTGTSSYLLEPEEQIGVITSAVFAVLSFLAVFILFSHVFYSTFLPRIWRRHERAGETPPTMRTEIGVFIVCLLVSDFIQSIAGMIQGRWAATGWISEGPLCTMQATLLQFGDNATAIWSSVIAIHTFCAVVLKVHIPRWGIISIVIGGWAFLILINIIGPLALARADKGPFYGIAGSWCFIPTKYGIERTTLHLIFMLFAAFLILVLYLIVFFVLRGMLVVDGFKWQFTLSPSRRLGVREKRGDVQRELNAAANKMLWYPMIYISLILPLTVCHLLQLDRQPVSRGAWLAAIDFILMMGAANAIIYAWTRRIGPRPTSSWFKGSVRSIISRPKSTPSYVTFGDGLRPLSLGTATVTGPSAGGAPEDAAAAKPFLARTGTPASASFPPLPPSAGSGSTLLVPATPGHARGSSSMERFDVPYDPPRDASAPRMRYEDVELGEPLTPPSRGFGHHVQGSHGSSVLMHASEEDEDDDRQLFLPR